MSLKSNELSATLREVADLLHFFKSEAVQLEVLEKLISEGIFDKYTTRDYHETVIEKPERPAARPAAEKKVKILGEKKRGWPKGKLRGKRVPKEKTEEKPKGPGSDELLKRLMDEGFFSRARTISEMMKYCVEQYRNSVDPAHFSARVAALVREKKLQKSKKEEGKPFEYMAA